MNTPATLCAGIALLMATGLAAQTLDSCGFHVQYQAFDADFNTAQLDRITALETGDQYAFYLQDAAGNTATNRFRRLLTDRQGLLLSVTDFQFPCLLAAVGRDGSFFCADPTAEGIRISRLSAPGDTIWSGIFGQPGLIPYGILDLGPEGLLVTGAEPYTPPQVFFPKGFLLKIDANHQQEWFEWYDGLGQQGALTRAIPDNEGGYFVEGRYTVGYFTYEEGIRFDSEGHFLWKQQIGTSAYSIVEGMAATSEGGLLATAFGYAPNGPGASCQFYKIAPDGAVLENGCPLGLLPDDQNYFVQGLSGILPCASGGFLTGLYHIGVGASRFVFMRLDAQTDTVWTRGFDKFVRLITPLPGDASLGYYHNYGTAALGLVKIGAGGELAPCAISAVAEPGAGPLRIAPNPAGDVFTIALSPEAPATNARWRLLDARGRLVREGILSGGTPAEVRVGDLPAGSYACWLLTENGAVFTSKLLISRP